MKKGNITRRDLLRASSALGLAAAVPFPLSAARSAAGENSGRGSANAPVELSPLTPPAKGPISVAFPISKGTVLIDLAGPWEVFQNATIPGRELSDVAFETYTVAETLEPVVMTGGLKVTPNYTFENAPAARVVSIPAQSGSTKAMRSSWSIKGRDGWTRRPTRILR